MAIPPKKIIKIALHLSKKEDGNFPDSIKSRKNFEIKAQEYNLNIDLVEINKYIKKTDFEKKEESDEEDER